MAGPMDRIKALDAIEKDIINCLQTAGQYSRVCKFYKIHNSQSHASDDEPKMITDVQSS